MLSQFFKSTARVRAIRMSPFGTLLEDFAAYLFESGYAEISARRLSAREDFTISVGLEVLPGFQAAVGRGRQDTA